MTINQSTLAQMNQKAANDLSKAANALGDKIAWQPLGKGRSALDQMQECAGLASFARQIFATQTVPEFDRALFGQMREQYDTGEKATAFLHEMVAQFVSAIEAFPADKLNEKVTLPFGGGMEKSFAEIALMMYWNMVYHEGQVNYIQTLCAEDTAAA